MKVIYLYNIDGWAIHDVGKWISRAVAPLGIDVQCRSTYDWHRTPEAADVVHVGYSALHRPWFDYRRWTPRLVTTIHDPCEISHFEDRRSWPAWPLRPLPLDAFDGISAISGELVTMLRTRYRRDAIRTPTWPSRAEAIRERGRARACDPSIRLFASTNAEAVYAAGDMLARVRRWRSYVLDERGHPSPRQALGLLVRRRRKQIPLLRQVARAAVEAGGAADLTIGREALRSRDEYENALHRCTVYACTSTMEGGPLPVMEAVLAGAAVVSTPVGQVGEWVEDGRNGRICRDYTEFRSALAAYAKHPATLVAHQRASLEIAATRSMPDARPWVELLTGERSAHAGG